MEILLADYRDYLVSERGLAGHGALGSLLAGELAAQADRAGRGGQVDAVL